MSIDDFFLRNVGSVSATSEVGTYITYPPNVSGNS